MPLALERKLKRQVAGKKISKERKDAYVYGTLRKTGWKPSREKKMNNPSESKLVRLAAIDGKLNSLIRFDDDDDRRKQAGLITGGTLGGAAAGVGGVLGHQAIQRAGGYGAVAGKAGSYLGGLGQKVAASGAWQNILKKLGAAGAKALSAKGKTIEFNTLLGPWQGSMKPESKIDQEQFPAGLSPAAALRLPFPQLMRLLNQRNLLQQVYSAKLEKLIELNETLDEIHLAVPRHLKQHFPIKRTISGTAITAGTIGVGVGAVGGFGAGVHTQKQRDWVKNAGDEDLLRLPMFRRSTTSPHDVYIDKYSGMYPGTHPRLRTSKISQI